MHRIFGEAFLARRDKPRRRIDSECSMSSRPSIIAPSQAAESADSAKYLGIFTDPIEVDMDQQIMERLLDDAPQAYRKASKKKNRRKTTRSCRSLTSPHKCSSNCPATTTSYLAAW
jgi:hypothetical protein